MKIYNEIILEWNEDTHKYDKIVSEDSFDYDGELMLAQIDQDDVAMTDQELRELSRGLGFSDMPEDDPERLASEPCWIIQYKFSQRPIPLVREQIRLIENRPEIAKVVSPNGGIIEKPIRELSKKEKKEVLKQKESGVKLKV